MANTGSTSRTFGIAPRTSRAGYEQWDAISGRASAPERRAEGIELTLQPYEATVFVLSDEPVEQAPAECAQ